MKPNKIIDYSLIVVSMLYSSYVSYMYLNDMFHNMVLAAVSAIFIVVLAHHYTYQLIEYFKETGKVNQYLVLTVVLMGLVFYAEWNGQSINAKHAVGVPTTESIDNKIQDVEAVIQENATHTTANGTNWAKYQTYLDAQKQLRFLQEQRKEQLVLIETKLAEAEVQANNFRFFSVILFIIAFVASSVKHEEKTKKETAITPTVLPKQKKGNIDADLKQKVIESIEHDDVIDMINRGVITKSSTLVKYFGYKEDYADIAIDFYSNYKPKIGFKAY